MSISTRKDLTNFFQSSLEKSSDIEQEKDEEDLPLKTLKSYIIESNLIRMPQLKIKGININFKDTKDNTLKIMNASDGTNKAKFFGDFLDKRFLIFYSFDNTKFTDKIINSMVSAPKSNFDYPWFFNSFMKRTGEYGGNESFSVKFENEFVRDGKEINNVDKLSMRLWGGNGIKIIDELDTTSLNRGLSLSNIGIKFGSDGSFIKENISFNGKFTLLNGTSINEHFHLLTKIKSEYGKIVQKIESNRIEYTLSGEKVNIVGEPIFIEFNEEIEDLKYFIKVLTSSTKPFRLWGINQFIEKDYVSTKGIDLHTGDKIDMDITKNWMRIYLPNGSCGNVITRLLTNIQHYFDSKSKLFIGEEEIK